MTLSFDTHPDRYHHWNLSISDHIATLVMDVAVDQGLSGDYKLKLNSYDLGVDIELADAIERLRFEHPEVHVVILTSAQERIFCAGANIFMLGSASHAFKVNFCKYTNETRLGIEDASHHSGIKFLAAVSGTCAGGGYELALACDAIFLVDDGHSSVSLPEVPLLGVLPGTGGLTRVIEKRLVRRDLADYFSTLPEGIKGKRAVEWKLVDEVVPKSRFATAIQKKAHELAALSDRPPEGPGILLPPLVPEISENSVSYRFVSATFDRSKRIVHLTVRAPDGPQAEAPEDMGSDFWPLQAFRELDRLLLHLRFNERSLGTLLVRTEGHAERVLACDATLMRHHTHWLVREIIYLIKRTLKRLDLTARSLFALIEPGSCFVGTLFELALAVDRSYMLDDPEHFNRIALSGLNAGFLTMGNGLTRLQTRFLNDPTYVQHLLEHSGPFYAQMAFAKGLVSFAPDELDWEDEIRLAVEERSSLSPDALTGMEANLRFAGPETLETKIFGRLSAWQNWVFQRPNAVGEKGALKVYGQAGIRPQLDWERT